MPVALWTAIITGMISVIGALGGVWLTQRHAAALAQAAIREARRTELRSVLVDVVTNAGKVSGALTLGIGLLPLLDEMNLSPKKRLEAAVDPVTQLQNALDPLQRQLTEAVLLVGDEVLRSHLAELSQFFVSKGIAMSIGVAEMLAGGSASSDRIAQRKEELREYTEIVSRIELRSSELLRISI